MIEIFPLLEIETASGCNRKCPTCMRSNLPNVKSWHENRLMPDGALRIILGDANEMGFKGVLNLQHFNEPLMDPRICKIADMARGMGIFSQIRICTNGDLINNIMAAYLDNSFDYIAISQKEDATMRAMFKKTYIYFTGGEHVPSHYAPGFMEYVPAAFPLPCTMGTRGMYINHLGEMLMCCEDMTGHFSLGNARTKLLKDLWYSDKHQQIIDDLSKPGGRSKYPWCSICPRKNI
jgi:radical SAM protein with 4Fe4S-binding SPASM domain